MKGFAKPKVHVNILCLAGAILALGCCLLAWTESHSLMSVPKSSVLETRLDPTDFAVQTTSARAIYDSLVIKSWSIAVFGAQVYLIGVALSFLSPLGGAVQLSGIAAFRLGIGNYLGMHPGPLGLSVRTSLCLAFWISIAAGALVIASLYIQLSPDFKKSIASFRDRLFAFRRVN